ncbi:MAG: hypothetical protein ACYTFG_05425 [Planctomycetota bacterium]
MGADYRIEKGIVFATLEGEVGPEDIFDTCMKILADPEFERGMNVLVDNSKSTTEMRFEDASKLVDRVKEIQEGFGHSKWATVSDSPLNFGISMMFSSLSGSTAIPMRAFKTVEEAMEWLAE